MAGSTALSLAFAFLAITAFASVILGAAPLTPARLFDLLLGRGSASDILLIETLRVPRTLLGLMAGAALGTAGALMQSLTRSPLADPGLLGINAGAAAAIVAGVSLLDLSSLEMRFALAFAGAAAAMFVVHGIGSRLAQASASTMPLVLAGVALTAALGGVTTVMMMREPETFDAMRHWSAGSLVTTGFSVPAAMALPVIGGLLLAGLVGRSLNVLALGQGIATGLGVHVARLRGTMLMAIVLLCGAATAAIGPIGFVGLMVPHLARMLWGTDERRVLALSALLGPSVLLLSDVAGRVLFRPAELQVGIVTAFVGAPVLIGLARLRLLR